MCASAHCIDHRKHVSIDSEVDDEDLASQSSGHRERCDEARRSSTKVIDVFVLGSSSRIARLPTVTLIWFAVSYTNPPNPNA